MRGSSRTTGASESTELGATLASRIAADGTPVVADRAQHGRSDCADGREAPAQAAGAQRLDHAGDPQPGLVRAGASAARHLPLRESLSRLDRRTFAGTSRAARCSAPFPGLYQLLPPPAAGIETRFARSALLAAPVGPQPDPELLGAGGRGAGRMAAPDARMTHIVGVNRETVVAVRRTAGRLRIRLEPQRRRHRPRGPGVAARRSRPTSSTSRTAISPTIRGIIERHHRRCCAADARRASRGASSPCAAPLTRFDDARLRVDWSGKIDWRRLDSAQREAVLARPRRRPSPAAPVASAQSLA